jgi:hypothetical protein
MLAWAALWLSMSIRQASQPKRPRVAFPDVIVVVVFFMVVFVDLKGFVFRVVPSSPIQIPGDSKAR